MRGHPVRHLLGMACLLVLLGHTGLSWKIPFVSAFEDYLYDLRLHLDLPGGGDQRVVVVDIDEASLAEIGRWPWSRAALASLSRRLTDDYEAAVVGFDMVFAEPDGSSGLKVLEALGRQRFREEEAFQQALPALRAELDFDRRFADAMRGRPVVLGYYFSNLDNGSRSGQLPPPDIAHLPSVNENTDVVGWRSHGANLAVFQEAARAAGHIMPLVDADGRVRRVPMLVEFEGGYYQSFSLAVLGALLGKPKLTPVLSGDRIAWLDVSGERGSLRIPVDHRLASLIPFRGPPGSVGYVSAADVLKGRLEQSALAGRIVLVGTTAPGLMDLRSTPLAGAFPGVEIHASLIGGILDGNLKEVPANSAMLESMQLLAVAALLLLLLPRVSPLLASLLSLAVLAGLLGTNFVLWHSFGIVLGVAAPLVMVALLYAFNMSWGYFSEAGTRRKFSALFGQYVPPELVAEMSRDPESYSMEGRSETLTMLFADIRGFTSLAESMPPRELGAMMNDYLGEMTRIVRLHRGTLDKYIGDEIMAFWGAPVADAEHARHAVLTALAMQAALDALAPRFAARGWPVLKAGVGVNTGLVTVGDMGSPVRKAYTVLGDAVNLASRLQGVTKAYGGGIVVGEATRALCQGVVFRELDLIRVKGRQEAVRIFEPLGLAENLSPEILDELDAWSHFLVLYRQQAWEAAAQALADLRRRAPAAGLYVVYETRLACLLRDPPDDSWSPVTCFLEK